VILILSPFPLGAGITPKSTYRAEKLTEYNCESEHYLIKALHASPPVGIRPLKQAGSDNSLFNVVFAYAYCLDAMLIITITSDKYV